MKYVGLLGVSLIAYVILRYINFKLDEIKIN